MVSLEADGQEYRLRFEWQLIGYWRVVLLRKSLEREIFITTTASPIRMAGERGIEVLIGKLQVFCGQQEAERLVGQMLEKLIALRKAIGRNKLHLASVQNGARKSHRS